MIESINETLQTGLGFNLYSGAFDNVDYKALHSPCLTFLKMSCVILTQGVKVLFYPYNIRVIVQVTGPEDEICSRCASPSSGSPC